MARLHLDDENDLGFVVDVIVEWILVVLVAPVQWVSGSDLSFSAGLKAFYKPLKMLSLSDVKDVSIKILKIAS